MISAAGSSASLRGADGVVRQVSFEEGQAELVSLIPGLYRLEVSGGAAADAQPMRVWSNLEVRAGETLRLDVDQ